jgi:hypothetical protein
VAPTFSHTDSPGEPPIPAQLLGALEAASTLKSITYGVFGTRSACSPRRRRMYWNVSSDRLLAARRK